MGAKIRGVSRATSIREWGCVASGGRTTLQWVHSLRSSRLSHWYRLARPSRTSRADLPPSARATRARSRPDLERALTVPSPRALRSPTHQSFRRDGVLSPAHRAPLGAAGHGNDWKADHGCVEPPGHAIWTCSREAVAAVQVRACPTRRFSPRARSGGRPRRCWFFVRWLRSCARVFFLVNRREANPLDEISLDATRRASSHLSLSSSEVTFAWNRSFTVF